MNSPIMLLNERIIKLLLNVTKANLGNMPTAPVRRLSSDTQCRIEHGYFTYRKDVCAELSCPGLVMFQTINTEGEVSEVNHDEAKVESV